MKSILEEVSTAVNVTKDSNESLQEFYVRLLKLTERLSDDEWEMLSEESQSWINNCVESLNSAGEITTLPDPQDLVDMGEPSNNDNYPKVGAETEPDTEKPTKSSGADPDKYDRYGLRKNQNASKAAKMFEIGATMKEVREATGGNHYNLLKKLEADGHRVIKKKGIITLIPKK